MVAVLPLTATITQTTPHTMSIPHNTTPAGQPNQYRVICDFGEWKAQGTDNNNVWQSLDYGVTYDSQEEAEAAAQDWAGKNEGEYIGVQA